MWDGGGKAPRREAQWKGSCRGYDPTGSKPWVTRTPGVQVHPVAAEVMVGSSQLSVVLIVLYGQRYLEH